MLLIVVERRKFEQIDVFKYSFGESYSEKVNQLDAINKEKSVHIFLESFSGVLFFGA